MGDGAKCGRLDGRAARPYEVPMGVSLFIASVAQTLASPPAPYVANVSPEARAAYEQSKDASPAEIVAALRAVAEGGDRSATEFLGEIYAFGLFGMAEDDRTACDLFESVAEHRPDSAHNFATCFFSGQGRPKDMPAAREWYARASEGGWPKAHCALGNMLIRGQGGEGDVANGLELCRLAANLGDADAQTDLGGYLLLGKVTRKNVLAARVWLERAAAQGHANAAFLLGQIHWKGDGTPRDTVAAGNRWRQAYEAGRPDAAFWVLQAIVSGMTKQHGVEGRIDRAALPEAIAWAELASQRDPDPSRRRQAADLLREMKQLQDLPAAD